MAKGTFGERLKRERELREVTQKEICSATRIAPKFLEALENEDWERLPGGVFGRGFVRSIARYLGLSEENLLSDYDLARGETTALPSNKPEERIPQTPKWIPALAVVLLLGLVAGLVIGGSYAWRLYVARRAAKKASGVITNVPSPVAAQNLSANASSSIPADRNGNPTELDLSVAASAATRIRVVADGAVVYEGEMVAGQNLHFSAKEQFELASGDLSALLLDLNGRPVSFSHAAGSSATISLSSKDLRPTASGTTQP
ncbi:MAG TPA: helix-turn-helix domain-containing protein [Candidatus Acidoferrum sp.]|jgi:cytoskeletal protein RodZ